MLTPFRRVALATTAIAGLALTVPGIAAAQNVIPGDTDPGLTIVTGHPGTTVTFDAVDRVTGAVSGTFLNESGMNLNCTSTNPNPNLKRGGTVSTAEVIRNSLDYYKLFQSGQPGGINAGSSIPFIGRAGVDAAFWPLLQLLPTGSVGLLSEGTAEATAIGNAHTEAKMHGMVGEVNTFTVNNGATHNWTATLSPASIGERGQDKLGALFVCRVGTAGQNYAWAGYEAGAPPAPETGSLENGSVDSGSLGSSKTGN